MKKDVFYNEAKKIYDEVIIDYKKIIQPFKYVVYSIAENEKVFLIEDSVVVFIGLVDRNPEYSYQRKLEDYKFFGNKIDMLYFIQIEELTQNNIYKFVGNKFVSKFNVNTFYFFKIIKFSGTKYGHGKYNIEENSSFNYFNYVNNKLPELQLQQRYDAWDGWLYYFIIFEINNGEEKGYCIWKTTNNDVNKIAQRKCKDVEQLILILAREQELKRYINLPGKGILYEPNFQKISLQKLQEFRKNKRKKFTLQNSIKYFIKEKYIKEVEDITNIQHELLRKSISGIFDNEDKGNYISPPVKWKSEYLLKELCEKIYGEENVIYQHRPYFLHTKTGQLSYDVYLPKKKIAIEYQGKQHFSPVDYFGGKESFQKQIIRDEVKQKLSEENGIKLIYISYLEPLTIDLIKQKINQAIKGGLT